MVASVAVSEEERLPVEWLWEGLEGVRRWNEWRMKAGPVPVDLGGVDLYKPNHDVEEGTIHDGVFGRTLCGVNLSGANLSGAKLFKVSFDEANLSQAKLIQADLSGTHLFDADFSHANLYGADLSWTIAVRADLSRAHLKWAKLFDANFTNAKLSGANLCGANLANATISGADLSGADLSGADLSGADLSGADLSGADLTNAKLTRAKLLDVNFTKAKLSETLLVDVDITPMLACSLAHVGPSTVDFRTIVRSGHHPRLKEFLSEAGLPELYTEYSISCAQALTATEKRLMLHSTFISYGTPDQGFAEKLRDALRDQGVLTFLFTLDAIPGRRISRVMHDGVNEYDRVILICSEASLDRPGVLTELTKVLARESRDGGAEYLIPIRLDDYVLKEWAPQNRELADEIRDRVVADFTDPAKFKDGVGRLIRALMKEQPPKPGTAAKQSE